MSKQKPRGNKFYIPLKDFLLLGEIKALKKRYLLIPILLLFFMMFAPMATATITPSAPNPADNATGIWVNKPTLTVSIAESNGEYMNGTIILVNTGTTATLSAILNGTQTLTIPSASLPLTALTVYQWWVNVSNETAVWVNTSYNFTTGTASRLSEYSGFDATQLLLVGLILIVVALVVLMYVIDIMQSKKLDPDKLIGAVVVVVILVIIAGFI